MGTKLTNNMTKETFEQFLHMKHMEAEPQILDDDLPDAFNDWLEMDADEFIKLGQEYGDSLRKAPNQVELKKITVIINLRNRARSRKSIFTSGHSLY